LSPRSRGPPSNFVFKLTMLSVKTISCFAVKPCDPICSCFVMIQSHYRQTDRRQTERWHITLGELATFHYNNCNWSVLLTKKIWEFLRRIADCTHNQKHPLTYVISYQTVNIMISHTLKHNLLLQCIISALHCIQEH